MALNQVWKCFISKLSGTDTSIFYSVFLKWRSGHEFNFAEVDDNGQALFKGSDLAASSILLHPPKTGAVLAAGATPSGWSLWHDKEWDEEKKRVAYVNWEQLLALGHGKCSSDFVHILPVLPNADWS